MSARKPTTPKTAPPEVETAAQRLARAVARWTGSTPAFAIALCIVVGWGMTGPIFHYSDTWQLIMNTTSSIVTFLMVFLIQRSQNKDSLAMHVKLNEIIQAIEGASNRIVNVEDLSESELEQLQARYQRIAERAHRAAERRRLALVEGESAKSADGP